MGVSAKATGNWEADADRWSSPLLFDMSEVKMLGKRPVKLSVAAAHRRQTGLQ